ncbi:hypothetical protein RGQ29_005502 [Quercus rubra]|uniref:Sodium channel modifier 1 acidic C-terminal domain-containing protein n=1 Tax=Quercus rubra TaxID=3512 RepID=A0AAN7E592_QUERU|nr:hypothetical protein RGQ29_005502 [Quercus rubra]
MSVFGGDSWGREAQHRKRRLDDLLLEELVDGSSYKKLSMANTPALHTKTNLSQRVIKMMHKLKINEINKRVALSDSSTGTTNCNIYHQKFRSVGKPLIEQTQNVASEILNNKTPRHNSSNANHNLQLILDLLTDGNSNLNQNSPCPIEVTDKVVVQPHLDFRGHRERELKFTAAGWKHDCQGKWFRDENVEFDSDEDDPNVCLG